VKNDILLETFTMTNESKYKIDYYVITMEKPERVENIKRQEEKGHISIEKVPAVVGANIDIPALIKKEEISKDFGEAHKDRLRQGEIGVYLSNLKIYDIIKKNGNNTGYSVLFEDDFEILTDEFQKKIDDGLDILQDIDFDILFLQNNSINYSKDIQKNHGELIKDHIYHLDKGNYLFGCVALLFNNKNIDKIIEATKYIDQPIDQKIQIAGLDNKLKLIMMYPNIVEEGNNMPSTIR
jgi:GR25 family glycosyltransferase involved in LPS biosynthesis